MGKISKEQDDFVTQQDNTRVVRPPIIQKIKLTPEQIKRIQAIRYAEYAKRNQARIYDADKAKYYRNLQNFYNHNIFGYGISGNQTRFDPTTQEGQAVIQSNFDYTKGNAAEFISNIAGVGATSAISGVVRKAGQLYSKVFRGPFKQISSKGNLGAMKQYTKNGVIGEGAEAVVVKNTPTTVGKITTIPVEEMTARNSIPNTMQSKYVGFVKNKGIKLPTYIQNKVKVLTKETFPKYVDKLDKAMKKSGFKRVNDPNVQYRAYTNGSIVIDDIAPGNVGLTSGNSYLDIILPDFLKKPQIIDMAYQTVPEWTSQGFRLKDGGKLQKSNKYKVNWETFIPQYPFSPLYDNDEAIVDNYIDNVLYTMENPTHKGFSYPTNKYKIYIDYDVDGNKLYNFGPGINKNSDAGKKLTYNNTAEYSREELNSLIHPILLKQMKEINKDLLHFTDKPDTMSVGNKMILLDIAHNVRPRNARKNMPLAWPSLVNSMIKGNPDIKEMNSGSTRRRDMRAQLGNKKVINRDTVKNK